MKELIQEKLREIEQREECRILLAVESGSRAWGFASPDSDYDVRFIYVRPEKAYLRLDRTRDVIEVPINDELDINGWDIDKTLRLLHKSNPTVFEWFSSPIIYQTSAFADQFRPIMQKYFSSKAGLWHYCIWQRETTAIISEVRWCGQRSTFMCSDQFWLVSGSLKKEHRHRCSLQTL